MKNREKVENRVHVGACVWIFGEFRNRKKGHVETCVCVCVWVSEWLEAKPQVSVFLEKG